MKYQLGILFLFAITALGQLPPMPGEPTPKVYKTARIGKMVDLTANLAVLPSTQTFTVTFGLWPLCEGQVTSGRLYVCHTDNPRLPADQWKHYGPYPLCTPSVTITVPRSNAHFFRSSYDVSIPP